MRRNDDGTIVLDAEEFDLLGDFLEFHRRKSRAKAAAKEAYDREMGKQPGKPELKAHARQTPGLETYK